jgi:hypothetical protein
MSAFSILAPIQANGSQWWTIKGFVATDGN